MGVPAKNPSGRWRGFTLVEVLLSLTLLTSLLLALNVFVFSMAGIWGRSSEQRLFGQHVRAVSRYVAELLRRAARVPATGGAAVLAREVRLPGGATEGLLAFELPEGDRLLVWPDRPLPDVQCALDARPGRGLLLYWHSHLELGFAREPPRTTVVSQLVTGMDYDYYDARFHAWQSQAVLRRDLRGRWLTPGRLRLHFRHGNFAADTVVNVPELTTGPSAF